MYYDMSIDSIVAPSNDEKKKYLNSKVKKECWEWELLIGKISRKDKWYNLYIIYFMSIYIYLHGDNDIIFCVCVFYENNYI